MNPQNPLNPSTHELLERLVPTAVERPWGGHGVPALGLAKPQALGDRPVGEYWLPTTEFPLLVKIIDAKERLSIQVHPDDATAKAMDLGNGKTEAWFVLDVKPGGELWLGLRDGVGVEAFLAAAQRGEDVSTLLVRHEPTIGETYFVPAGAIHAVGGGLTILEVQQPSDVTFRLYDWGRLPARPLHHAEAARSVKAKVETPRTPPEKGSPQAERTTLVSCDHFEVEEIALHSPALTVPHHGECELWFCRAGSGACAAGPRGESRIDFVPGTFFLARPGSGSLQITAAHPHGNRPFVDLIRILAR